MSDASPFAHPSVAESLIGFAKVDLEFTEWFKGGNPKASAKRTQIDSQAKIADILASLEPRQILLNQAARCLFSYSLTFRDASGNKLGEVGICESPTYGENHEAVFVLDTTTDEPVRMGMIIPDAASLVQLLDDQLE